MDQSHIRNFCIIAHIDHGKSTLADRLLELTGTVSGREMAEQVLDQMDLEREKGVTIKAQAVRMNYRANDGQDYQLNLIDTPGHVDFSYEVSRSLAACEGALLVVDAAQGIQAQTLANVYVALEHDLVIIPVINKIELPSAQPELVAKEIERVIGLPRSGVLLASAKEGVGMKEVLEAVVERIPSSVGHASQPLRALIFDSKYDTYKGVVAYVRVMDGAVTTGQQLRMMATDKSVEALEVGIFAPRPTSSEGLSAGEVGYVATGLKDVRECPVGDTLTSASEPATIPLHGYRAAKPMVFAGLYPVEPRDYGLLRDALAKLKLNDASLIYDLETSTALGFGFRCGFLGLFHMEIIQERLEREYDLNLIVTAPSVEYQVTKTDGSDLVIYNPAQLPAPVEIREIREPWTKISVITPGRYIGTVMELVTSRRGQYEGMEYLEASQRRGESTVPSPAEGNVRVMLKYSIPLSEMLVDFYDQLKSRTQGYASLDYFVADYRSASLVKLDILVNNQPVDALSRITHRDSAHRQGRTLVQKLRSLIPRQLFDVPLQAAIGQRVIARETVKALRKNVLAKCYGGDVTRKRKLLEKQAEGKKRMKRVGNVEIPQEAFMAVLRLEES